jgi:ABC-type Fe3+-siderophore transport system permease subunit
VKTIRALEPVRAFDGMASAAPPPVWTVVLSHLGGAPAGDALADQIGWQVRTPRVLMAFIVGAGLAVACRIRGRLDPSRVLLAGVALSYLFQAGTTFLQLRVGSNQLAAVLFWLLGTVAGTQWSGLVLPSALVAHGTPDEVLTPASHRGGVRRRHAPRTAYRTRTPAAPI